MGHEAYGSIVALGSSFKHSPGFEQSHSLLEELDKRPEGYTGFKIGQKVRLDRSTLEASAYSATLK